MMPAFPFHFAGQSGHVEVAPWLREAGADEDKGTMPMHFASEHRHGTCGSCALLVGSWCQEGQRATHPYIYTHIYI